MRYLGRVIVTMAAAAYLLAAQTPAPKPEPPKLPDSVEVEANVAYDGHPQTVVDIMKPKGGGAKRPAVIVIHGGGWTGGSKEGMVQNHCLPYLQRGFVVANVEYRLAAVAPAPAAVQDVLKAADWFLRNAERYGVDRRRVLVTGGSAGGHLALMVGMTPKSAKLGPQTKVAAVVNFYGITDVGDQLEGPHMQKYAVTWVPEQAGRFDLAKRVSPMTYVRKDVPPILTIHGDADKTVPYEHGVKLTKALRGAGADAELMPIAGGGHGFPPDKLAQIYDGIWNFLGKRGLLQAE
jgi:acetyl esterase/lipase